MSKERIIKFRITEEEDKELQKKACEYGMSVSGYCRHMIFEGKENQKVFYEKVLPRLVYIGVWSDDSLEYLENPGNCPKENLYKVKENLEKMKNEVKEAWGI